MEKIIENFTNYTITDTGIVTNTKTGHVKSQWLGRNGYLHVDVQQNGVKKKLSVHRLLAMNFIPNPENKEQVNHIDGNKQNNKLENLEWNTRSENTIHAYKNELIKPKRKIDSKEAIQLFKDKIVNEKYSVTKLAKELNTGLTQLSYRMKEASRELGVQAWYSLNYRTRIKTPVNLNDYPSEEYTQVSGNV